MAVAQRMSETDFVQFVQAGTEGLWELHNGRLMEKPGMSWEHLNIVMLLSYHLQRQLDRAEYRVVAEGRVRRPAATVFMPDIAVVPTSYGDEFRGRPGVLAIFSRPLPLVVEVWSASTGDYDVTAKLPVYQQRGDREIWLIHPYERRLTAWRRLPDGTYRETRFQEGIVHTETLPDVAIDLAELFDEG